MRHLKPDPENTEVVERIRALEETLTEGLALVSSAFAHVSHGGPTRADAEKWINKAEGVLK